MIYLAMIVGLVIAAITAGCIEGDIEQRKTLEKIRRDNWLCKLDPWEQKRIRSGLPKI